MTLRGGRLVHERRNSICISMPSSDWLDTPAEDAMFDSFDCQCIYVEVSNEAHPHSGSVEYRAKSCAVCQARAALLRADTNAIVAFDQFAPRYQRMH